MQNISSGPGPACGCQPVGPPPRVARLAVGKPVGSTVVSLLIAFFPKCPLCWAAYMSMLGNFGLANLPYLKWLLPVLLLSLGAHLLLLLRQRRHKGYGPFVCSLVGALIIVGGRTGWPANKPVLLAGMLLVLLGSLWNTLDLGRPAQAGQPV